LKPTRILLTVIIIALLSVAPSAQDAQNPQAIKISEFPQEMREFYTTANGLPSNDVERIWIDNDDNLRVSTSQGQAIFENNGWRKAESDAPAAPRIFVQVPMAKGTNVILVDGKKGRMAVDLHSGLFPPSEQHWEEGAKYGAIDKDGNFWMAGPRGVVCRKNDHTWHLITGKEGLPCNDITSMASSLDGEVWFGTSKGAIRYDGKEWRYRQGLRWLPDDEVRDVAVTVDNSAWFATKAGVGVIRFQPMTLAQKAKFYEDQIDKFHRRTEYEYVLEVALDKPGDTTVVHQHDSDNDGLWTAMYGAGECFAYAATKNPQAKDRAKKAFCALKFLGEVTQGGSNPAPKGFVARSILPTSGQNPNDNDNAERDRNANRRDSLWKIIEPRWPTSEDGKWYWKTDTSSDELDGHFFFYALYYDLVAETPEEKEEVRAHVGALATHLVDHDFCLVDHDGKPTRWAVYSPKSLNLDPRWYAERGLNSLSILSYLLTAEHITGDSKYAEAADRLVTEHGYLQNTLVPKTQAGPGTGNQSDDEMAFMCYYNALKYEKDPQRKALFFRSLWMYWRNEEPEMCPLFNFIFAAQVSGGDSSQRFRVNPRALEEAVDQLVRFPLDRFSWGHTNSHRLDVLPLPFQQGSRGGAKGYRVNGRVIPVDERFFNHWNTDPWSLDTGGNGGELADGAVFLLPYYMGLYHGFIIEG